MSIESRYDSEFSTTINNDILSMLNGFLEQTDGVFKYLIIDSREPGVFDAVGYDDNKEIIDIDISEFEQTILSDIIFAREFLNSSDRVIIITRLGDPDSNKEIGNIENIFLAEKSLEQYLSFSEEDKLIFLDNF